MDTLILVHVGISLIGIFVGFIVAGGMLGGNPMPRMTWAFLWSTVATSATGFFIPARMITPAHILGVLSVIVLALAIFALHHKHLAGKWRAVYVLSALVALYFNSFVLVVQLFAKTPALKALAPNQTEPPFAITQFVLLAGFIALGIAAAKRFRAMTLS